MNNYISTMLLILLGALVLALLILQPGSLMELGQQANQTTVEQTTQQRIP